MPALSLDFRMERASIPGAFRVAARIVDGQNCVETQHEGISVAAPQTQSSFIHQQSWAVSKASNRRSTIGDLKMLEQTTESLEKRVRFNWIYSSDIGKYSENRA
jgi:hypothetical protein